MKKFFCVVLLCTICILFYTGCDKNSDINQTRIYKREYEVIEKTKIEPDVNTDDKITYNNISKQNDTDSIKINEYVKKIVDDPNIKKAILVTTARDILVGLKLSENIAADKIIDIKTAVKSDISKNFGNSKEITIITAGDLYKRMEKLSNDIENNKPITGFFEEIQTMIKDLIPVI